MPSQLITDNAPALARHEGVWQGTYRRFGADGQLMESFPSILITRFFDADEDGTVFHQTNRYRHDDGAEEVLDTRGVHDGAGIRFTTGRVSGFAVDDAADPHGRSCLLYIEYGAGQREGVGADAYIYETVQISDDGQYRVRAAQFIRAGRAFQRTWIDEEKITDDWQTWEAEHARTTVASPV